MHDEINIIFIKTDYMSSRRQFLPTFEWHGFFFARDFEYPFWECVNCCDVNITKWMHKS